MRQKIAIAFIAYLFCMQHFYAQIPLSKTAIPDSNFEKYLETHDIDGEIDGQNPAKIGSWVSMGDGISDNKLVFTNSIADAKSLDISGLGIVDLEGLQDFTMLETLNFSYNRLAGNFVVQNTTLKNLLCGSNELIGLDISASSLLTLNCSSNQLATLVVSSNADLETLICSGNQLTTIDISNNLKLVSLGVSNNQLPILDISNNLKLINLSSASNQLISLDISDNILLESLDFSNNRIPNSGLIGLNNCIEITSLNVSANKFDAIDFSNLTKLKSFNCDSNRFTELDLSSYLDLNIISCAANQLRTLNIKNGKNPSLKILNALYNPKLYCIQVDDVFVTDGDVSGWQKDELAGYSSSMCEIRTYVPDDAFEAYLEANAMGDGVLDNNFVLTANIEAVASINVNGKSIADLSGIEDFIALENLNCSNNSLINLDISKNRALTTLNCSDNALTSLNLGSNTALTNIDCSNNVITNLNLGTNSVMTTLDCADNALTSLDVIKNTALTSIDCSNNTSLSNLNLGSAAALTVLNCYNNALTSLNLGSTTALTTLNCYNNVLTSLDLGSTNALETLNCHNNQLTSLNMTKNLALTTVNCSNNLLSSLNLGANSVLTVLDCSTNSLENIDLTKNTGLTTLNCSTNSLASLNLNSNVALVTVNSSVNALIRLNLVNNTLLKTLNLTSNSLLKLNVKNGNNTAITSFDARSNPNLSCIDVDVESYSTTNWANIDGTSSFSANCNTTYIPDANFEAYLETHDIDGEIEGANPAKDLTWKSMGDGIDDNNFAATDEIKTVTTLNVIGLNITDLAGLADFVALLDLNCSDNSLISLDLRANVNLITLDCSKNTLAILDVSTNSAITTFDARDNLNLSCIKIDVSADKTDWLKDPAASYNLNCNTTYVPDNAFEAYLELNNMGDGISNNNFVSTDKISSKTVLEINTKGIADLTGIEDFTSLQDLNCSNNSLIYLDLSSNTALTTLNCSTNQIDSFNISGNTALISIDCSTNELTSLDFSGAINLTSLTCNDNLLTSVNIKNGANGDLEVFNSTSNPALYCIEVDDAFAPDGALAGWQKDSFTLYSAINCADRQTLVPDDAFEQALIDLGYDSILDGKVLTSSIEGLTKLNVNSKNILDLTGIEDFRFLTVLDCSDNYLKVLNIQSNSLLATLNCGGNNLETLNVTQNRDLVELLCDSNNLKSLDVSQNTVLELINCNSNNLESLDATSNVNLLKLVCASNKLTTLIGISSNPNLTDLDCSDNYLSSIAISGNVALINLNGSKNNLTVLSTGDNANLEVLNVNSNKINSLDLSANTVLHKLNGSSNNLESLSLTSNIALDTLNISGNKIASIILEANTNLISLDIFNNVITSLSLSNNNLLDYLNVSSNLLETLDVTNNTQLKDLNVASNQFSGIDVATLSALLKFNCSSNRITGLDLNMSSTLTNLNCSNNQLVTLSLRSWANNNLVEFNALSNSDLTCIEINDIGSIGENWSKDAGASYSLDCRYSDTYVPDDAFEQALINLGYDTVLDNYVLTSGINTITTLDVSSLSIADLTGIEGFTALETLDCSGNSLTDLVLSKNTALTTLMCTDNALLTSLDVSINTALTSLTCSNNTLLANLDLSSNTALTTLNCSSNDSLTSLNLGSNTALISLDCSNSSLANLDLANNIALRMLDCSDNLLTNLDLATNSALTTLNCATNELTGLDLIANTVLTTLNCSANQMENLDISNNSGLISLFCSGNLLTTLNAKNGNNGNLAAFNASSNPNLYCIEVDASFAPAGGSGWQKDAGASFAENCRYNETDISNANFEAYLETHDRYGDIVTLGDVNSMGDGIAMNNIVFTDRLFNVEGLDISGLGITDLTGIEDFLNLVDLDCSNNALTSLDIQENIVLTTVNCSVNQIESLNLSTNIALVSLFCNDNLLTRLNIKNGQNGVLNVLNTTSNPYLYCIEVDTGFAPDGAISGWQKDAFASYTVNCTYYETFVPDDNFEAYLELNGLGDGIANNDIVLTSMVNAVVVLDISALDITDLTGIEDFIKLEELDCSANLLTDLLLERNKNLVTLHCNNNSLLTSINLVNNTNLTTLNISGNHISTLDISTNTKLVNLDISENDLASLSLYDNNLLENLNISSNFLSSIDLSSNLDISTLICNNNDFSNLELSNNIAIVTLNIASNQFSSIDLTKLTKLEVINGSANRIKDVNLTLNRALTDVNFNSNDLITFNIKNGFNTTITSFNTLNNPNLTCVEVDSPTFASQAVGWLKDLSSEYLIECHYGEFYVPDDAFEQALIYLGYDSGPLDNYVPNGAIKFVTNLTLNNNTISDLTGIEKFTNLVNLDCRNNNLGSLDLSGNLLLETLKCSGNQLVGVNVSGNTQLKVLNISNNILGSLDVSASLNLKELNCSYNQLTSLEVNPAMEILDCSHNQLNNLSVSNTLNLTALNCSFNQLNYFDFKNGNNFSLITLDLQNNPDLWCVLVDDILAARGYEKWLKDPSAIYKLECVDNDDDGVANVDDICPTTPFGVPVDLFGCPYFSLPASNFTVLLTGETCISSNNGKINIVAEKTLNYTATVIGVSLDFLNTYKFTKDVNIFNLRSGAYELCVTIEGRPEYSLCYDISITEPKDLSVFSKVSYSNKNVILDLTGGTNYTVDFNGLQYTTTDSQITLNLSKGENIINIKTDLECQGKYAESIYLSDDLFVYPNPFDDFIKLYTGGYNAEKIEINIYSTLGQLVLSKDLFVKEDFTTLDTSNMTSGIYYVSVKVGNSSSVFKIIKK